MPPGPRSRYTFCKAITDTSGRVWLSDREPFGWVDRDDNRRHTVREGEHLWSISAAAYRRSYLRPSDLFWVIADFQPVPIFDPTVKLTPGRVLHIPSVRLLEEEIFNEARRIDHQ